MMVKTFLPPPTLAWLFVFAPALSYFVSTRLSSGFWSELGISVQEDVVIVSAVTIKEHAKKKKNACQRLAATFYLATAATTNCPVETGAAVKLSYPLRLVQSDGLDGIVDTVWRHDSELGRGYLLLSQASGTGRVWRWEVGGGPIAIGKTLHLEESGCRSNSYQDCRQTQHTNPFGGGGSGALATDFYNAGDPTEHAMEGALLIAEWGEGRIVRLENNGARTPILMNVPCATTCAGNTGDGTSTSSCRLPPTERMVYTAKGDLVVAVNYGDEQECPAATTAKTTDEQEDDPDTSQKSVSSALVQLAYAAHVPPLMSLRESRDAHSWEDVSHNFTAEVLYADPLVKHIGGIAVTSSGLFFTATRGSGGNNGDESGVVLMELPMQDEDDINTLFEEEDDDASGSTPTEAITLLNISNFTQQALSLTVAQSGRIFVAVPDGILLIDPSSPLSPLVVLGKVRVPEPPTSLTLGGDGYLYASSIGQLYRIRTREKPVELPTDRVARKPKNLS